MVGALGVWTLREAHQPVARDGLSGPLPFCQTDNDCQSDDEVSRTLDIGEATLWLAVSSFGTQ